MKVNTLIQEAGVKIVDKKQPTNTSLLPTVWIGSPESPVGVGAGVTASARANASVSEADSLLVNDEDRILQSA